MVDRAGGFHNPGKRPNPHRCPGQRAGAATQPQETPLIRITVSYPGAEDQRFDHAYYQTQHRQLLLDRLAAHGLQRVEIDKALADGAGGKPPVVAAAHLIFNDLAGFQQGMAAHGREITGDVAHYTDIVPTVLISEMA